jgi:signal transduction histidine kinase
MPEGGRLTVTISRADTGASIDFTDTGHGSMPPENIDQIFEPYFSTKETGVGLGLALTRRIIAEHGARIAVTSSPGAGATFHITGLQLAVNN